jgi:aminopeptidase N
MKRTLLIAVLLLVGTPALSVFGQDEDLLPHFPADRPVDVSHIKLDMRVDLKGKTLGSKATIALTALRDVNKIQFDAVDFKVGDVKIAIIDPQPVPCDFENDGKHITLMLPSTLKAGQKATVEINYSVSDPKAGLSFFQPTKEDPDIPSQVWSQGESVTNRYWVPCMDNPNEMQTTEVICTVDKPNLVVSNGKLVEKKENSDGTSTFHWLQDKPHVSYLMTLVVGQFYEHTDQWRGKPVSYYVREKYKDRFMNSFANTPKMLEFFSNKIGVEYAWDKYAQVCCYGFGGGMENTSATTLTEGTLHDDRAHLDGDSEGLVAHELAHQWWGDLLTCKDWAHIWLNEGFASYFEALWDEESQGQDEFAWNMRGKAEAAISGGADHPIVWRDYKDPNEQFDSRAYPKGAWVLHMIRRQLGDDQFWQVLKTYATKYRHKSVETMDLCRTIEEVSGRAFERYFYDWTERPGAPEVETKYQWLADDHMAQLRVRQTQKDAAFFFPLMIEFVFESGTASQRYTRDITSKETTILLPLKQRPRYVRIDPDMAVLMTLKQDQPRDCWVAQLEEDASPVGRARGVSHFAETKSDQDVELLCKQLKKDSFYGVQGRIAESLGEIHSDAARDALLDGLNIKDHKARRAVVSALGKFSDEEKVATALQNLVEKGDPSYRVEAQAIESYANVFDDDPTETLMKLLDRNSEDEIIRAAVLRSLGEHGNYAALDELIDWSKTGKPFECRSAAVQGIASMFKDGKLEEDKDAQELALNAIRACLKKTPRNVQGSALRALGSMGAAARPAIKDIEALTKLSSVRTKKAAEEALKNIRQNTPQTKEVDSLRDELDELKDEKSDLLERIEKLEARVGSEKKTEVEKKPEGAKKPEIAKKPASKHRD